MSNTAARRPGTRTGRPPGNVFRRALGAFLLLLLYDGAIRKWLLPGMEQIVFITKDALLLAALLHAALGRRHKTPAMMQPVARMLFTLYAVWAVLEMGNPALPNLLVAIWGLKSHLLYASLVVLLPLAFRSLDEIFQVLAKIYPWAVIPVCSLAFAQLAAPPDSFINQQVKGGTEGTAYFGEASLVRVTGTFSYISGMAAFVEVATLLGIGLFMLGVRSRLFLAALGFALAALPATGSRAVVAVVLLGSAIQLLSSFAARLIGLLSALRVAAALAILVAISLSTQDAAWEAFAQRLEGSRQDESRAATAFTNAFVFLDVAGATGFGTGSANLGAPALAKDMTPFSWLPGGGFGFEEESGRLVLELGLFGWMLSLGLRATLLLWAAALLMGGRTRAARTAAMLALPVMALAVHQGSGVFGASFTPVYYWFCVALLAMAEREHRQASPGGTRTPASPWREAGAR